MCSSETYVSLEGVRYPLSQVPMKPALSEWLGGLTKRAAGAFWARSVRQCRSRTRPFHARNFPAPPLMLNRVSTEVTLGPGALSRPLAYPPKAGF